MNERELPPVTQLGMASLALIVAGGIYLSAHLPRHVPLGPAVALLAASVLLLLLNIVMLSRVQDFAWDWFFAVAKWSLLAYIVIAGMIEYAFLQGSRERRLARGANAVARGVRGPRPDADGVHGRAVRRRRRSCGRLKRSSSSAISRTTTTASGSARTGTAMTSTWSRRLGSSRTS